MPRGDTRNTLGLTLGQNIFFLLKAAWGGGREPRFGDSRICHPKICFLGRMVILRNNRYQRSSENTVEITLLKGKFTL